MKVVVFLSKWVGKRCAEFLLNRFPDDDYRFIVGEAEAADILDWLSARGAQAERLSCDTIREIEAEPVGTYDWLLNLWGSHIFKPRTLERARQSLNIHPALLPIGRGRDPVVWAIRKGWPAGVTLHQIDTGVDTGAIWYQEEVPYTFPVHGGVLYDKVIERSWRAFCEQWPRLREGTVELRTQDSDTHIFRRTELLADRTAVVDGNPVLEDFVRRLCAHDFSETYTAQLVIGGRKFAARLELTAVELGTAGGGVP